MEKEELMCIIGKNLQHYREKNNLTQEELAERVGISTSFCANLERGKKAMSIVVLRKLADALNVSVDYLLYENRPSARISNISSLLGGKPETFVASIERIVRVCVEEFGKKDY